MAEISRELEEALKRCNQCGFCQARCPVYKVTGIEWMAARGRIALINNALVNNRLGLDDIEDTVYNCLACNACLEDCPGGVETADIIFKTREELLKRQGQPRVQELLLHRVLADQSAIYRASRLLRFADVTGLRALARKTGLTRLIGSAGKAEAMVPPVPSGGGLNAVSRLAR